jgi:carboxyl-terminal processing protease
VPVNDRTAVKLTTARYFTPNGRSIQAEGIVPDIELANVRLTKGEESTTQLKEADLARHLTKPDDEGEDGERKPSADAEKDADESDYALSEALNLLKGLAILRPMGGA